MRDILEGRVAIERVERAIANTSMQNERDWDDVFQVYSGTHWRADPARARQIALTLRSAGKIVQPRVDDPHYGHSTAFGHWLPADKASTILPTLMADQRYLAR